MKPCSYRLGSEILAIIRKNDHPVLVTIPEGSRVTISSARVGSRMIDVIWEGVLVTIFTQDLDERGILDAAADSPVSQGEHSSKSTAAKSAQSVSG